MIRKLFLQGWILTTGDLASLYNGPTKQENGFNNMERNTERKGRSIKGKRNDKTFICFEEISANVLKK